MPYWSDHVFFQDVNMVAFYADLWPSRLPNLQEAHLIKQRFCYFLLLKCKWLHVGKTRPQAAISLTAAWHDVDACVYVRTHTLCVSLCVFVDADACTLTDITERKSWPIKQIKVALALIARWLSQTSLPVRRSTILIKISQGGGSLTWMADKRGQTFWLTGCIELQNYQSVSKSQA